MASMQQQTWLEKLFALSTYNTTVRTEFIAGVTTFITMAYIIIVQPNLMKAAGMPVGAVAVSTILISAVFSMLMGLYANRPFALAPTMGGNAFFAYSIVAAGDANWQTALGMVMISGICFLVLTLAGIREAIAEIMPKCVKNAVAGAVGLFIFGLGLTNAGIVLGNKTTGLLMLGSFHKANVILAVIGLVITLILMIRKVKGAVFYGIIVTAIVGIPLGITKLPQTFFSLPPDPSPIIGQFDIKSALSFAFFPLIFTFFTGEFFSTLGTVLGLGAKAKLLDEKGNLPEIQKPFIVDSLSVIGGAAMGMTPVSAYIESASGVEAGGRTGLTAVFTGVMFLLALFVTPLIMTIPSAATAPALILIGLSMLTTLKMIHWDDMEEMIPALFTVLTTGFSFSIANGIVFGVLSYVIIKIAAGKIKEIPWGLYLLCVPLIYYLWLK